jgi:hypothetical protein
MVSLNGRWACFCHFMDEEDEAKVTQVTGQDPDPLCHIPHHTAFCSPVGRGEGGVQQG